MNNAKVLIKSKDRVRDVGEVFTPDFLVEQMLDQFPKDAWGKHKNWLEPTCGNGQFIIGILRRKLSHGHTLLEALDTTFGVDIMPDNIGDCHVRIYKEIVMPYVVKHSKKFIGKKWKDYRWKVVSIVETNIKPTKDSLKEDFSKWVRFVDRPQKQKDEMSAKIHSIFRFVDEGTIPCTRSKLTTRLFKEMSALKR